MLEEYLDNFEVDFFKEDEIDRLEIVKRAKEDNSFSSDTISRFLRFMNNEFYSETLLNYMLDRIEEEEDYFRWEFDLSHFSEEIMLEIVKNLYDRKLFTSIKSNFSFIRRNNIERLKKVLKMGVKIGGSMLGTFIYDGKDVRELIDFVDEKTFVEGVISYENIMKKDYVREMFKLKKIDINLHDPSRRALRSYLYYINNNRENEGKYDETFNRYITGLEIDLDLDYLKFLGGDNTKEKLKLDMLINKHKNIDEFKAILSLNPDLEFTDENEDNIFHYQDDYEVAKYIIDNNLFTNKRNNKGLRDKDSVYSVIYRKLKKEPNNEECLRYMSQMDW